MKSESIIAANRRNRLFEKGLCVNCGKNPVIEGMKSCQECSDKNKERHKERRAFLKEMKLCYRCGINRVYGKETQCPECRAKEYANYLKREPKTEADKKAYNDYSRSRHQLLIEQGLCTRCAKRKATMGRKCGICHEHDLEVRRLRYAENGHDRVEKGLCYYCGNKAIPGLKVCKGHYQNYINRKETANETGEVINTVDEAGA